MTRGGQEGTGMRWWIILTEEDIQNKGIDTEQE